MNYLPDTPKILGQLKLFQRDTVDYVFRRMYEDDEPARRFLIADEVGLGKTIIARGLIARVVEHLSSRVKQINIVYICSNREIADQNIKRLRITDQKYAFSTRPTLLPFHTNDLNKRPINFISFTPGTAFRLKEGGGVVWERALLYWLLDQAWNIKATVGSVEVLRERTGVDRFREIIARRGIFDETLTAPFVQRMREDNELKHRFFALCANAQRGWLSPVEGRQRRELVGALRLRLAETCLDGLKPTLIILDEFQRFKDVLEPAPEETDEGDDDPGLARQFFTYVDRNLDSRILLLSATPYKMYTLSHEEDNHYEDFLQTLRFLRNGPVVDIEAQVERYRLALLQLGNADTRAEAYNASRNLQQSLQQMMVRTERLAATDDRNGMLKTVEPKGVTLSDSDIDAYLALKQVMQIIKHHDPMEYWKSAPYLLNFMLKDEYKLKSQILQALENNSQKMQLGAALASSGNLLLRWEDIEKYLVVDPGNARLRSLIQDVTENGAWQLLWIPPALPYYGQRPNTHSPWAKRNLRSFTKRLVFSSWQVVPKAVASLLSYAVEQRITERVRTNTTAPSEERKRRSQPLRIALTERRLPGSMSLLVLLYPCLTLAIECDPLRVLLVHHRQEGGSHPSLESVRSHFEKKISVLLDQALPKDISTGPEDEQWYWAAPLLLDRKFFEHETSQWFGTEQLASTWSSAQVDEEGEQEASENWKAHVARARETFERRYMPRGRRPADLAQVLAEMAMASPAVASLRALWRVIETPDRVIPEKKKAALLNPRYHAAWIAWAFRALFNQSEASDIVRDHSEQEPYWRRVLSYCVEGNLQATLDEYSHILRDSLATPDDDPENASFSVAQEIYEAISLRVVSPPTDIFRVTADGELDYPERHSIRNHFAVRFSEVKTGENPEETKKNRAVQIRKAFNSPFWPFVLVTTSIGQEGLDFHNYCHAVVHWNLPTNPVDMEQREGRVHRYKGHAVRKNVAQKYGLASIRRLKSVSRVAQDPWADMFMAGLHHSNETTDTRGLIPYWICEGDAKIQRHVPVLPLSRDAERLEELRHALTLYRMVFGQARQEDLVRHLLDHLPESEVIQLSRELSIQLEPPLLQFSSTCDTPQTVNSATVDDEVSPTETPKQ